MYGEVLSKAWKTIWKHKVLWIFGFLAGCGVGGGAGSGRSNFDFSKLTGTGGQGGNNPQIPSTLPPEVEVFITQLTQSLVQVPGWFWLLLLAIFFLVIILVVVLSTTGRAGLVLGTWESEEGVEKLPFGQLFEESLGYFWRVFFLGLVIGLIGFAILLVMALPLLFTVTTKGVSALCFIPLCCIVVPILWLLNVWQEQAVVAAVGEDLSFAQSLSGSWALVRRNLALYLIMSLILGIGSLVASFIVALPLFIILWPLITGMMSPDAQGLGNGLLFSGIALLCYMPVLIVFNSILKAYMGVAWTLTYRWITMPPKLTEEIINPPQVYTYSVNK
jgi:hypothetical protein